MPLTCLTLIVPELLWPDPKEGVLDVVNCPALAALLTRGRFSRRPAQETEKLLMTLFGHAGGAGAALRLRGESEMPVDAATAYWIATDPVHLAFDGDRLILTDGSALNIAPEEAAVLANALNGYFTDLGIFHAACAERWYLRLADGKDRGALERIEAPPVSAIAGRNIEILLLEIMENRTILKIFNEIQTFLDAHPVNRRRKEDGKAPINSLWFWGGGSTPPPSTTKFDEVSSTDALALGLARTAGLPARPLPENAGALFATAAGTRPLVVLDGLGNAVRYRNGADYRRTLATLETGWFAPAQQALAAGVIGSLRLIAPTVYGTLVWEVARPSWRSWSFWRRPRTLAETARVLTAAGDAA